MRYTLTVATLPDGEMVRQYGRRASITLDSDSLGYPGNHGRSAWDDATTPRTDKPVFFRYRDCGGFPFGFDSIVRRGFRSKMTRA